MNNVRSTPPSMGWALPALLAVLAAAAVLAVWGGHTGAWMDTIHYVEAAEGLARGDAPWITSPFFATRFLYVSGARPLTEWPLLFPGLIAVFLRLGLDGILAARILSAAAYVALPFALWPLARRALDPRGAVAAVTLSMLAAGLYEHATAGMSDTVALTLTALGVARAAAWGDALATGPTRASAYGAWLFLAAAAATRYSAAFVLPGVVAWLFLRARAGGRLSWLAVWTAGMGLLAVFPLLFKKYATVYPVFDVGPLSDLRTNVGLAAWHIVEDMFLGGTTMPGWFIAAATAAGLIAAAACALCAIRRHGREAVGTWASGAAALCAAVAASYIGLMIWTAAHRTIDPLNTRYVMPAYPFLFVVLASMAGRGRVRAVAGILVAVAGLVGAWRTARTLSADDFPPPPMLVRWAAEHWSPDDIVLSTDWHVARWTGRPVYQLPISKWTGTSFSEADAALATRAPHRVFLVIRRRDVRDATAGRRGEYGAYVKALIENNGAPDVRSVATLPDDLIFLFSRKTPTAATGR